MDRRAFLRCACFASLGWGALSDRPPNIIFIMADDLGYGELGCYGQTKIETPHVDRLAKEGMRFTQYYAGSAVCAPSRCVLMTGQHGGHAFVRNNLRANVEEMEFPGQHPIPSESLTVAEILKERGYATGCFGKWGLGRVGSSGDPLKQGFDRFFGYNCQGHAHNLYPKYLVSDTKNVSLEGNTRGVTGKKYAPALIADQALSFLRQHKDEPFFLYYATVLPHLALQAPDEEIAYYKGRWEETPYHGKSYQPHPTPKACYAAMITFLDKQVGRILAALEELGLERDTVVLFTSDNGTTHLKEQVDYDFFDSVKGLRGLKGSLYEGGIRVPMVVRWPGRVSPDSVTDHLSSHYDVLATLSEITGSKVSKKTDGISFLSALEGRKRGKRHEFLLWDFPGYGGQIAVRMGRWKGIKTGLHKEPDASFQLYDLKKDPFEERDLASEKPKICEQIEEILARERTVPVTEKFRFGRYAE